MHFQALLDLFWASKYFTSFVCVCPPVSVDYCVQEPEKARRRFQIPGTGVTGVVSCYAMEVIGPENGWVLGKSRKLTADSSL